MSQHDYVIANASGATVRADLNSLFQAMLSQNSGTSAPTTTAAGMFWLDTTGGAPYTLKVRDAGNNHWLTVLSVTDPGSDGDAEIVAPLVTKGGTGQTSWTQGDILYSNGSNSLAKLGAGTSGQFLKTQGSGANPAWADVSQPRFFYATSASATISNTASEWANYITTVDVTSPTAGNYLYIWTAGGGFNNDHSDTYSWTALRIKDDQNTSTEGTEVAKVLTSYINASGNTYYGAGSFVIGRYLVPSSSGTITVRCCPYVSGGSWSMYGSYMFVQEVG